MSNYGVYGAGQWTAGVSDNNWEHQGPPSRSGASSVNPREETLAFAAQFDEVERAYENFYKSGKSGMFNPVPPPGPGRREPMMMGGPGRDFPGYDPRMGAGLPRQHPGRDFSNDTRSFSGSNVQGYYAAQRQQQPPRGGGNEAEQAMQATKRMAAQRERELRNYHQEQQYNRSVTTPAGSSTTGNDRTMSPASGMSEDERRDLIARQRNALYGEGGNAFSENAKDESKRPGSGGLSANSPQAAGPANDGASTQPKQERSSSNELPTSTTTPTFGHLDNQRTSASSPGDSPPNDSNLRKGSVAPIGTRPSGGATAQTTNPVLTKQRSVTPSPLAYGYSSVDDAHNNKPSNNGSNSGSASATPEGGLGAGWNNKNGGIWGAKNPSSAQASVWG